MKTTITPEMAEKLLENNSHNRKLNIRRLNKFKRDIINGMWLYNGESIIVSKTGKLIDGQHRLVAVVETGIPIETNLVDDVDDVVDGIDIFAVTNTENRSLADVLYIEGFKDYTQDIVRLLRLIDAFERKALLKETSGAHLLNHEIVEYSRQFNKGVLIDTVIAARKSMRQNRYLTVGYWSLLHYIAPKVPKVDQFIKLLEEASVHSPSQIRALMQRLGSWRKTGTSGGQGARLRWIALFKALDYFRRDKELKELCVHSKMEIPYPEDYDGYYLPDQEQ